MTILRIVVKNIVKYYPAIFSGLLLTLSFPGASSPSLATHFPWLTAYFPWLAWIALIPLIISLKGKDRKNAFCAGFIMGFVHFLSLLYWIVPTVSTYGQIPIFLAVPILMLLSLYLGLYPALFALGVNCFYNAFMPLTAASMWVALEYLRSMLFSGFPWGVAGSSQYMNLTLIQIADITSVYGVSFIIVMTNGVLAMSLMNLRSKKSGDVTSNVKTKDILNAKIKAILNIKIKAISNSKIQIRPRPYFIWCICLIIIFTAVLFYGKVRITQIQKEMDQSDNVTLAVIQGNIDQIFKWDRNYQENTIAKYCELSMEAALWKPDLIVWPETALPFYYGWNRKLSAQVDECIKNAGSTFLIGTPAFEIIQRHQVRKRDKNREGRREKQEAEITAEEQKEAVAEEKKEAAAEEKKETTAEKKAEKGSSENYEIFNRAYMMNPRGFISGSYDKIHLVPFGEYVPLGKYLSFLGKIIAQAGDFSPGDKDVPPLCFNGSSVGVLICFEIIFPYLSRDVVNNGAQILVNMTNDAWFGYTSAPEQHFSMAVFRAIENRRSVARAANTGISGFVEPTGNIAAASTLYEDAVLSRSLPTMTVKTFYSARGDLFAVICLICIVAMVMLYVVNVVKNI